MVMKLHFEPNLDFQLQAVEAVLQAYFAARKPVGPSSPLLSNPAEPQAQLAFALKTTLGSAIG